MARQRDYKAEYARRVQRERNKAAAEGRQFSRAKARGHRSRTYESTQRAVHKLAKQLGVPKADVRQAVQEHGWNAVRDRLERKTQTSDAYLRGESGPGHDDWQSAERDEWPDIFFWYHAAFG